MFKKSILSILFASLISCGGTVQPPVEPPVVPNTPKTSPSEKISAWHLDGDGWQLEVPHSFEINDTDKLPSILVLAFDKQVKRMVILARDKSDETLESHATLSMTIFSEQGIVFNDPIKVDINGTPAIKAVGTRDNLTITHWFLVNGGFVYTMGCGGLTTQAEVNGVECDKIAATLRVFHPLPKIINLR